MTLPLVSVPSDVLSYMGTLWRSLWYHQFLHPLIIERTGHFIKVDKVESTSYLGVAAARSKKGRYYEV